MNYKGKLYGKIQNYGYFDTGKTSDDFDEMLSLLKAWTQYIDEHGIHKSQFGAYQMLTRSKNLIKKAEK